MGRELGVDLGGLATGAEQHTLGTASGLDSWSGVAPTRCRAAMRASSFCTSSLMRRMRTRTGPSPVTTWLRDSTPSMNASPPVAPNSERPGIGLPYGDSVG